MAASRFTCKEIRKVREALGWTLKDVLEKSKVFGLDITEATLSNWETGDTCPPADKIDVLAMTFGVGLERFYPTK